MNTKANRIAQILNNNIIMLLLFELIGMIICVLCRYEVISDLNNYHYQVAWAFFHGRTFTDIAVGLENSYHNPLVEFPIYFLINNFNEHVLVYQLYNSIYWGLLAFVFYLFVRTYFNVNETKGQILAAITMLLVMTGYAFLSQNGTSSHEIPVILGIMSGLYLMYKEIFILKTERLKIMFISGLLMGLALGLKLTVVIYCISSGLTLMLFYKILHTPFKTIGTFALGGLVGFLLTFGWWAVILYNETGNPIFPYMNTIFKSPYYPDEFLTYSVYFEKNWWNWIVFPFLSSLQGAKQISAEGYMIDLRLFFGYVLLIAYVIRALYNHRLISDIKNNQRTAFLVIFAVVSYAIWFYVFSIIRYAIPIEMIICLMLVYFVSKIKTKNKKERITIYVLSIIGIFNLLFGLPYDSWGSTKTMKKVIDIEEVKLPDNSLLIGVSSGVGLTAAKIADMNTNVKIVNEAASFIIEKSKYKDVIEEYKKNASYTAYLVVLRAQVNEFDKYTPVQNISLYNTGTFEKFYINLKYLINKRIGVDNFYCRNLNHKGILNKTFMCIDKKDKYKVFPQAEKEKRYNQYRRFNNIEPPSIVFK